MRPQDAPKKYKKLTQFLKLFTRRRVPNKRRILRYKYHPFKKFPAK